MPDNQQQFFLHENLPRALAEQVIVELLVMKVLRRLPNLRKLDGIPIDVDEREAAKAA